jgi:hypothetical protein
MTIFVFYRLQQHSSSEDEKEEEAGFQEARTARPRLPSLHRKGICCYLSSIHMSGDGLYKCKIEPARRKSFPCDCARHHVEGVYQLLVVLYFNLLMNMSKYGDPRAALSSLRIFFILRINSNSVTVLVWDPSIKNETLTSGFTFRLIRVCCTVRSGPTPATRK